MIEKNKESHNQSLAELQQELKSLKALLLSSRGPSISSGPTTPLLPAKPSIPAWQLAASPQTSAMSAPSTPPPAAAPYTIPNGKGKEVAAPDSP